MDATAFWIGQQTRKFEVMCSSAASRVALCKTMQEVVRAADVHAPAEVRQLVHSLRGYRNLKAQTERRLEQLLEAQLAKISLIETLDERKTAVGQLRARDWQALRGEFASIYRKADRAGQQLLTPD